MTIEFLTDDTLGPFRHGFFTRRGGASSGIFAGLNCGLGSHDQRDVVRANRRLVAAALGVPDDHLLGVRQIHSAEVAQVHAPFVGERPRCDAMVTDIPGLALGILTADCQPVLFADQNAGVVAAAHAGWKGALAGILEATIAAMEERGARRQNIHAVIGPAISQSAYEVGPEFRDRFCHEDQGFARFFTPASGDRWRFDLTGFGLFRLQNAGLAGARALGLCTYGDAARFYSYRRATHLGQPDYGRLISAIVI